MKKCWTPQQLSPVSGTAAGDGIAKRGESGQPVSAGSSREGSPPPSLFSLSTEEPPPIHRDTQPIWELVVRDMKDRDALGRSRYGTPLQAHNGRDALVDAYQEALDLAVYLRQAIEERKPVETPLVWKSYDSDKEAHTPSQLKSFISLCGRFIREADSATHDTTCPECVEKLA